MPLRVVLDTNVIISAALAKSSVPATLFECAIKGVIRNFYSDYIKDEVQRVSRKLLVQEDADELVRLFELCSTRLQPKSIVPTSRDVDGDNILACAKSADADLIITGDQDLLTLKTFENIPILTPRAALTKIQN